MGSLGDYSPPLWVKIWLYVMTFLTLASGFQAVFTPVMYVEIFGKLNAQIGFSFTHGDGNVQTWGVRQAMLAVGNILAFYLGEKSGFLVSIFMQALREVFDFALATLAGEYVMSFITFNGTLLFSASYYVVATGKPVATVIPMVESAAPAAKKKKFFLF